MSKKQCRKTCSLPQEWNSYLLFKPVIYLSYHCCAQYVAEKCLKGLFIILQHATV